MQIYNAKLDNLHIYSKLVITNIAHYKQIYKQKQAKKYKNCKYSKKKTKISKLGKPIAIIAVKNNS